MAFSTCVCFGLFAIVLPMVASECSAVSDATSGHIAKYAHDRFGFAPGTTLKVAGMELVGSTCYRKVRFVRSDGQGVPAAFYLSPDQRFLSHDLMDLTTDSTLEREKEDRRLKENPLHGSFPTAGSPQADITIVVFSDFECPLCKQEAEIVRQEILPADSNVRLVFRNLPLPIHPWARIAAEMAACVYEQSNLAFWEVHDALFMKQQQLTKDNPATTIGAILRERGRT